MSQYRAGENSKIHFEMRTQRSLRDHRILQAVSFAVVLFIGGMLALIASMMVMVSAVLHQFQQDAVDAVMRAGCDTPDCKRSSPNMAKAYLIFVVISLSFVLTAALFTALAPAASGSGLPGLKAFLNGCHIPKILRLQTLAAKIIGTTLVVTSGLPIGREGPMVHIGAALAACISSIRWPIAHLLFEMRLPMAQRNWAGIGAAAGVAAAFNAPLGGILYSFEEVCSHWSSKMTWLSYSFAVSPSSQQSTFSQTLQGGTFPSILYSTVLPISSLSERPLPAVSSCGSSSWELREVSSGPYTTYAPFTSQECDGGFIGRLATAQRWESSRPSL